MLEADAQPPVPIVCAFVFQLPSRTAFSNIFTKPYTHQIAFLKAGSVSPNQPATSSLAINSPPRRLGHLQALGAHLRSAIGRKPAVLWETCSIQDPSGVINRKQNKQATCALCSALCIQRALLAPRFSWQDAATTRTGLEESLLRRVTVAASINPLEPCSRWVSARNPSTRNFPSLLHHHSALSNPSGHLSY